jgi:CheY-like chemotaxis protein
MQHDLLVVSTDAAVLTGRVTALKRAGYAISACASFPDARRMLNEGPSPDVLVTDVRLGPYNGLHLVAIARVEHPRTLAVVIGAGDPVLEGEARGLAARYVVGPLSGAELSAVVADTLMVPRPRRRWPRKRPTGEIPVLIGGQALPGRVLDVSYGGIGLEVFGADVPNDAFEIVLPDYGVGVQGTRVWTHRMDPSHPISCGIALPPADPGWRIFVDELQAEAVHG